MAKIMNASQKFPEGEPTPACFQEDHRLWGPSVFVVTILVGSATRFTVRSSSPRRKNTSIYKNRMKHLH